MMKLNLKFLVVLSGIVGIINSYSINAMDDSYDENNYDDNYEEYDENFGDEKSNKELINKIINVTEYLVDKLKKMDKNNPEYIQISEKTNKLIELLNNKNIIEELNENLGLFEYIENVYEEIQCNNNDNTNIDKHKNTNINYNTSMLNNKEYKDKIFDKAVNAKIALFYQDLASIAPNFKDAPSGGFPNPNEIYYNNSDFSDIDSQYDRLLNYVDNKIKYSNYEISNYETDEEKKEYEKTIQECKNILNCINYLKNIKTIYHDEKEISEQDLQLLDSNYLTLEEKEILGISTNIESDYIVYN